MFELLVVFIGFVIGCSLGWHDKSAIEIEKEIKEKKKKRNWKQFLFGWFY